MAGGRLWTDEENEYLVSLIAAGKTNAEIYEAWVEKYGPDARTKSALARQRTLVQDGTWDGRSVNSGSEEIADDLKDYTYIDQRFLFVIGERMMVIPFEQWDTICRDYSQHGTDLTCAEVARKHGIPVAVLRRCLKKYGHFKASPPNCRERIEEHKDDFAPLVAEALENDEHRFLKELEGKRDREWRKDYMKLKRADIIRARIVESAQAIASQMPTVEVRPPKPRDASTEGWVGHFPTTDEHAGKLVWSKESFGRDLDTPKTAHRLRSHADATVQWIEQQSGYCRLAYRTFLGDLFHALMGETEHGTKLDQDTRAGKVWAETAEACVYSVAQLASVCERVEVRGAKGNHDGFLFYIFLEYLKARLDGFPNVTVKPTPASYDAFRVGTTLHVLDHGYRVGSLSGWKAKAQAEVVAREIGGPDFHGAEMIYTYVGHLHEEEKGSSGSHLKLIRLPSLGESDDFETSLRYASLPTAHLFMLREDGKIDTEKVLYRSDFAADEAA